MDVDIFVEAECLIIYKEEKPDLVFLFERPSSRVMCWGMNETCIFITSNPVSCTVVGVWGEICPRCFCHYCIHF